MIALFSGTSEGKNILSLLNNYTEDIFVSTATEYGGELLSNYKFKELNTKPLDFNQLKNTFVEKKIEIVLDASHPYALEITENLMKVCRELNLIYLRYERPSVIDKFKDNPLVKEVQSYEELKEILQNIDGTILNTTGSRSLDKILSLKIKNRIVHRVLPTLKVMDELSEKGIKVEDVIAIKGPISYELNVSFIREYKAKAILLKDSGVQGGTEEKLKAAIDEGIKAFVIGRKESHYNQVFYSEEELVKYVFKLMDKKGVLVVSFGTTYKETRKKCIESIENKIKEEFKNYDVRRAFTSNIIIKKLRDRDNLCINNVKEALEEFKRDGIEEVYVQSLHLIPGEEYYKVKNIVEEFKKSKIFKKLELGRPLLYFTEDYKVAVNALKNHLPNLKEGEAVILMGHGTDHHSNISYIGLQHFIEESGMKNVFIANVEGYPELHEMIHKIDKEKIKKIFLVPYMLVAGDHARNDMAGEKENSWKKVLETAGFQVEPHIKGLGENKDYQEIFVQHLKNII